MHHDPNLEFEANQGGPAAVSRRPAGDLSLLVARQTDPVISATFPLARAGEALELLASGTVGGKIVLTCDGASHDQIAMVLKSSG